MRANRNYYYYRGVWIERAGANSSGMRWHCFSDNGQLRADTLLGMKELIRGTL